MEVYMNRLATLLAVFFVSSLSWADTSAVKEFEGHYLRNDSSSMANCPDKMEFSAPINDMIWVKKGSGNFTALELGTNILGYNSSDLATQATVTFEKGLIDETVQVESHANGVHVTTSYQSFTSYVSG